LIFILLVATGCQSYGHSYICILRKSTATTLATLSDKQQGVFYMHRPIDRTAHTTAFGKPVVDHWLERKIAQTAYGSTEKDRSDNRLFHRQTRYRLS